MVCTTFRRHAAGPRHVLAKYGYDYSMAMFVLCILSKTVVNQSPLSIIRILNTSLKLIFFDNKSIASDLALEQASDLALEHHDQ